MNFQGYFDGNALVGWAFDQIHCGDTNEHSSHIYMRLRPLAKAVIFDETACPGRTTKKLTSAAERHDMHTSEETS